MAGKQLDVDKIQLEVTVDGSPARKELAETKQEVSKLKSEYGKLQQQEKELMVQRDVAKAKNDHKEYKRLQDELRKVRADAGATKASMEALGEKTNKLRESLGTAGLSANELRGYIGRLKGELNAGVLSGTDEEIAKIKAIEELEARYKTLSTTAGKMRLAWEEERKNFDLNRMSLHQLGLELDRWEEVKNRTDPNSPEWKNAEAAVTRVKDRIHELTDTQRKAQAQWDKDRHSISLTAASVEQLALEEKRLQAILANPNTGLDDKRQAAEALRVVQDRTEQLTNANRIAADVWEQQRKELKLVEMDTRQLGMEQQRLQDIISNPATSNTDRANAAKELALVKDRTEQLTNANRIAADAWEEERQSIALMDMSLEQLNQELARYKAIQQQADPKSSDYTDATAGIAQVKDRLEQLTNSTRMAADEWVKMRGKFKLEDMSIQQLKLEKQYLDELRASLQRTDPALDQVERDFIKVEKALKDATEQTALQERQWEKMRGSMKLTDMSIEELERELGLLNKRLKEMKPADTGFDKMRRDAQAAEAQLARMKTGLGPFGRAWQEVKVQVASAGAILGGLFAGGAIMQGIRSIIQGSAKLSDELAEVQKVTGKSADEVKRLNSEISKIDTRTATTDLRGIAVGLGQAGEAVTGAAIGAIDKINLALGSEFGASAKEITNTVSVLRNNLRDVKSENFADDVGRIGNAILVLGQSGLATAPVVSDIGNRIAGVAGQFGVTSGQILGTAASFQELGISTERGSTAYTKLLQKMSVAPQAFAEVVRKAGGDAAEFTRLVNTDMQAAFLMMAKSARTAGDENTAFGAILKELETSGAGVSELLSKVGANTELFAKKAALATEALKDQNAINAQAALANNTLGAQIDKLGKLVNRVFTSPTVVNWVRSAVSAISDMVKWVRDNSSALKFWGEVIVRIVSGLVAYRLAVLAGTLATKADIAVNKAAAMAQAAYAAVVGVLTGKITLATAATKAFGLATKFNPIGLLIAGATTAIGLFATIGKRINEVSDAVVALSEEQSRMNMLFEALKNTNEGSKVRADLIKELNETYAEYLPQQLSEANNLDQITKAQQGANAAYRDRIRLQARSEVLEEKLRAGVDLEKQLMEVQKQRAKTVADGVKAYEAAWYQVQDMPAEFSYNTALKDFDKQINALTDDIRVAQGEYEALLTGKQVANVNVEQAFKRDLPTPAAAKPFRPTNAPGVGPPALVVEPMVNQKAFDEASATVGAFDAEINRLKQQLEGISDPAKGQEIQDLIAHYKQLRAAIAGGGDAANTAKDAIDKHIDELSKLAENARLMLRSEGQTEDAKDLAALKDKQAKELDEARKHAAALVAAGQITPEEADKEIAVIETANTVEEATLRANQATTRELAAKAEQDRLLKQHNDAGRKLVEADRAAYKQRLEDELAYWDEAIALAQEKGENPAPLQRNRATVVQKIELFDAEASLLDATKYWDDLKAMAEKANQEQVAAGLKATFDITAIEAQKARMIEGIKNKSAQKQLGIARELNAAERALQIKRLQDFATVAQGLGTITSAIQQNAETAADADGKRTKAESARIRRIALLNIAIQTATAIANGVASAMSVPFPGNLAAAATTIATVIGLMGQASALLGSSGGEGSEGQNNPNWSDGNLTLTGEKGIRELPGPSHARGGLDVVDTTTGKRVANIEGGEAVINKEVAKKNPEVIDSLLDAADRTDKRIPPPDSTSEDRSMSIPVKKQQSPGFADPDVDSGEDPERMAQGGVVGMDIPSKKQKNPGLAAPEDEEDNAGLSAGSEGPRVSTISSYYWTKRPKLDTGGVVGMDIPIPTPEKPGADGHTDPDSTGTAAHMAQGGVVGMAIPVKKQKNPGVANAADGGAAGSAPQTAIPVKKQKNPGVHHEDGPLIADLPGMRMDDGGIFGGSLHRDGGNAVIDNRTGQVIAEVEKDEPWMVLSRAFREKNSHIIPTLLEASRKGLRLEHISTGAVPVPNPQRVAQAMRIAHFADGGLVGSSIPVKKQKKPGLAAGDDDVLATGMLDALTSLLQVQERMLEQNQSMIRQMGEVNEGVRKFPTNLKAYTVLNKEHDRTVRAWEAMKSRYSARA